MVIQDLTIKKIEPVKQIIPKGGSGTGYCQYTTVKVIYENDEFQTITMANWYTPKEEQIRQFKENTQQMLSKGYYVIHSENAIAMLLKALGHK